MSIFTEEYQKYVINDLETTAGLSRAVHASLAERLLIRKAKPRKLHPNPGDEFSQENVGPNYTIIENYVSQFRHDIQLGEKPVKERIVVEKISTGGYRILNGHHRWFAAYRVNLKKIPIEIVNLISSEEIISKINNSENTMCVSFDLDEVLMTDRSQNTGEDEPCLLRWFLHSTLRKNTGALISQLQKSGFDVWIYTSSSHSERYIRGLFALHHANVTGIINGVMKKKFNSTVKDTFCNKYRYIVHIDQESVLWVNTQTKDYDSIEIIHQDTGWAAEAMAHVRNLDFV